MTKKMRVFHARLILMCLAMFMLGIQVILWIQDFWSAQASFPHILTILVMLFIWISQLLSQLIENQRHTTQKEFRSASILQIDFLDREWYLPANRLLLLLLASALLGGQISSLWLAVFWSESILTSLLGTTAMLTLLIYLIFTQIHEDKLNQSK